METWRKVFRSGFAPLLSKKGLEALAKALAEDDPRLIQGATTSPPPLYCIRDWPIEGACLTGYAGWHGDDLQTVAEVEEYFARLCFEVDLTLGEPASCRWTLNAFDEMPREEMRREFLPEVLRELARRSAAPVAQGVV